MPFFYKEFFFFFFDMRNRYQLDGGGEGCSEGGEELPAVVGVFEETSTFSTALLLLFFCSKTSSAGRLSLENIAPADLEMTTAPAAAQAIMPMTVFVFVFGSDREREKEEVKVEFFFC